MPRHAKMLSHLFNVPTERINAWVALEVSDYHWHASLKLPGEYFRPEQAIEINMVRNVDVPVVLEQLSRMESSFEMPAKIGNKIRKSLRISMNTYVQHLRSEQGAIVR